MTDQEGAMEAAGVEKDADTGRVVRVTWTDSGMAVHGWQSAEALRGHDVAQIETVGLWFGESDRLVIVSGSRDVANGNWGECQLIWKPAIIRKEWIS